MKEASGELSMTAITVVAIAAIGGIFTVLIWPSLKANITRSARCTQAYSCNCPGNGGLCECKYLDENNNEQTVKCPDKTDDNSNGDKKTQ